MTTSAPGAPAARPPEPAGERAPEPGDGWPSLNDYGVIGNESTGALVSRDGAIEWACLPRFDSPSVFAALLDRRRGGAFRILASERLAGHQQYVAGTNVLTTFLDLRPGVTLTVTDFMPMGPAGTALGGDPRIVRRLSARGAPIEVTLEVEPRFDYARLAPTSVADGLHAVAKGGESVLWLESPWPWSTDGSTLRSSGSLRPGPPAFVQLRWGGPPPAEPSPAALLAVTDAYWRGWVAPPEAPLRRVAARWHPWVERSELVLKLLSYADTGVFVAAPTTSLPEWPGGPRNWDYRFVWIRDAAFTAQVFLLLGHVTEARAYVGWALDRAAELKEGEDLRALYTLDGKPTPAEVELPHLSGYLGSGPVRVGNLAAEQRQLDIYGEILDSALMLERVDPAFVRDRWSTLERLAERVLALWKEPDSGLWESRTPRAHYVHSKVMCWVALDRAVQLARAFGRTGPADRWSASAEEIRATILARGYNEALGSFVQTFDGSDIDASALRIGLVGFLPPTDPRVLGTIDAVEHRLARGPFVYRYDGADGVMGPEASFLLCAFWLVESLAKAGRTERALEHWRALLETAGPLLLFAEEYDPAAHRPLGNYPQAFTHIGVLRAAFSLGLLSPES